MATMSLSSTGGCAVPLAAANTRSPSKGVWEGTMALANPSCAAIAMRCASLRVRFASVATMAIVVCAPGAKEVCFPRKVASRSGASSRRPACPNSSPISNGAAQNLQLPGMVTEPTGFAATSAPTVIPFPSTREAEPRPPLRLAVVAPVPAPAVPSSKSVPAFLSARRPRPPYGFPSSSCRRR